MDLRLKPLSAALQDHNGPALRRSLGPVHLTMMGVGSAIGTGIFVLTAEAAQKAGPGMIVSFVLAGFICAVTALCYAELAAMVPAAGSAYTYSYIVLGEAAAWLVGWALILEYAVAAAAVAVGWSGYIMGLVEHSIGIRLPAAWVKGPYAGGLIDLPAVLISLAVTGLLIVGTRASARVNSLLVGIKLCALAAFVAFAVPAMNADHFQPFAPLGGSGIFGAAASIFFSYVGFDAVSTAAEEARDPQRTLPIALIASLAVCVLVYLLVAAGVVGAHGAQPLLSSTGHVLESGSRELTARCGQFAAEAIPLPCSHDAIAHVLRQLGHRQMGNLLGLAAGLVLPSVILTNLFGQTRIFFAMSRDGLLPQALSKVHPRFQTPHVVTSITGVAVASAAAFFPVGQLADVSNSGTLVAFIVVAMGVLRLRRSDPLRPRPFRAPVVWIIAPVAILGCVVLFAFLPPTAQLLFPVWSAIGGAIYLSYGYRRSRVGRNVPPPN